MGQFLLLFLLFFLPFVIIPSGVSTFEGSKVLVAEGCIILLGVLCVMSRKFQQLFVVTPLRKGLLIFLSLCILHLFFSRTDISLFGNPFRMQGLFLYTLLFVLAWISSLIRLPKISAIWIMLILALHLFLAVVIGDTQNGRFVGRIGEANAFGALSIFLLPWIYRSYSKNKRSKNNILIALLGVCFAVGIILLSGSRSAMVAFGVQGIFFMLIYVFRFSLKRATIISLLFLVSSIALPFFQKNVTYENRVDVWESALIAGFEKPVFGYGFGNVEIALQKYNKKLYNNVQGYYVDSSHNVFLDWWLMGGVIGISVLFLLIRDALRSFVQRQDRVIISILLGLLTVMLFNPASITTLLPFWWVLGQSDTAFLSN
jgi:hypothetical protein